MKGKTNQRNANKKCFHFKSKYKSMKTIFNSLKTISTKFQHFFSQLSIDFNSKQFNDYNHSLETLSAQFDTNWEISDTNDGHSCGQRSTQTRVSDQSFASFDDNQRSEDSNGYQSVGQLGAEDTDESGSDGSADRSLGDYKDTDYLQSAVKSIAEEFASNVECIYDNESKSGKKKKRFRCAVSGCELILTSRANMSQHYMTSHSMERDHQCCWPNCGKSFGTNTSLISHLESYHLRKERFKCCVSSCGEPFVARHQLLHHMSANHSNDFNHICVWTECQFEYIACVCLWPDCGQEFSNKKLLDSHVEDIHLKSGIDFKTNEEIMKQIECKIDDQINGETDDNNQDSRAQRHRRRNRLSYVRIQNRNKPLNESKEPLINKYTGLPLKRKRREKVHPCQWPACEAVFDCRNAVEKHMRKHTGEKPFACDWEGCDKTFRNKNAAKLHKEMIHLKLKQFKCDWIGCDEAFISMSQLTTHKTVHTGLKKYKCDWPGCLWTTNWQQQLAIHRMRTHEGVKLKLKRYKCRNKSDPNSEFDFRGRLKKYQCDWPGCDKRFRLEHNLETHMKSHQKSDNELSFERKSYRKPRPLKEPKPQKEPKHRSHKNLSHTFREKAFKCEYTDCEASYTTKSMLVQHMNTHTGSQPYKCQYCEQCFAYLNSLRSHVMKKHSANTRELAFKCQHNQCDQSFENRRGLSVHLKRVHSFNNYHKYSDRSSDTNTWGLDPNPYIPGSSASFQASHSRPHKDRVAASRADMIRLERIQAFNTMRIQTQIQSTVGEPIGEYNYRTNYNNPYSAYRHIYPKSPKPVTSVGRTTHTTASKLLKNAMKAPKTVRQEYIQPIGSDDIARELPHPCTHSGCIRRFKSEKALVYHNKKYHSC